ncbi:glycoside hydrolase family 95 protein [Ferruginibacter paludis]|uniref:glycoside hydrolase family 95 protein n=1 Tax=Ferruginibacter paludis TaxID=1310417 RepID=UPI0025B53FC6|nr:glycoside hydrolase family 95 protein [Ferruginibacter paludis]MDN3655998.1 glycoside hydrolase family 95 protein [Ferruginibacter paludis]
MNLPHIQTKSKTGSLKKRSKIILLCKGFIILFCHMPALLFAQEQPMSARIDQQNFSPATLMWYKKPAAKWEDALPVGNGRLGAMVYGKTDEEIIQLNEDTYWSGGPYSTVVKDGYKTLPVIQQLVFDGEFLKAHNLFGRKLMGYPVEQQKYQSLANLHFLFPKQDSVSNYKRWLNLETATTGVSYSMGGVQYQREIFASAPDQVIVIRFTADKPGSISFSASLHGERNQTHSNYATDYFQMDSYGKDGLKLTGKSADYMGVKGQLKYEAIVKAIPEGGRITMDDATLTIENANAVTLYFAAATNFVNYQDVSANAHERVQNYLGNVQQKKFTDIRAAHITDHQLLFKRAVLTFPGTTNAFLPTDERLHQIQTTSDPQLAALCYQFGRYILIASSREGTQAANLQGIWNNNMNPPWDAKYTTNINTQMNYWAVESANLSECASPLYQLVKDVTEQGAQVAKEHYGASGWVLHQNTDLWRVAAPMDGPTWGTFTVGGAWLVNELWEHYKFTRDIDYVKDLYPILKGSVDFFMHFLVKHPNGKWLVTNPSTSPENFPGSPKNGPYFDEVTGSTLPGTTICAGSSIDMQILSDLFTNYEQASKLLGKDTAYAVEVAAARKQLVPPQTGKDGSLQEWSEDWPQLEKNHRHFSHLYGLYPGNVLSVKKTPQWVDACKAVLNQRGDEGAGWSRAWKMSLWARLYDGERAYKIFKGYLKDQCFLQLFAKCFTPMQVDGSLGVTAGITEMLVQSHEDAIDFLPALPKEWSTGSFEGVCVRGGFELNFSWQNNRLIHAGILSKAGAICTLHLPGKVKVTHNGKPVKLTMLPGNIAGFQTQKNAVYQVLIL